MWLLCDKGTFLVAGHVRDTSSSETQGMGHSSWQLHEHPVYPHDLRWYTTVMGELASVAHKLVVSGLGLGSRAMSSACMQRVPSTPSKCTIESKLGA